jgi:serine O-acetyltransferase
VPGHRLTFKQYGFLVRSDLHRYAGTSSIASFVKHLLLYPGFKYSFWMRTCAYLAAHRLGRLALLPLALVVLKHCEYKYGISIPYRTQIGSGLYIGHFGGIVVNSQAVIGKNCNLSHQVTLGEANRGARQGFPVIGDAVGQGRRAGSSGQQRGAGR